MPEFTPFLANIMSIIRFNFEISNITHSRIIKNYELDYYVSGSRKMTLNGKNFKIGSGSLVFRKPGDQVTSIGAYNCYCLTLDFSMAKQHLSGDYNRNANTNEDFQQISDNKLLELIPPHLATTHTADFITLFDNIILNHKNTNGKEICNHLLNQLFFLILSEVYGTKSLKSKNESTVLFSAYKYIQENFQNHISIEQLSRNVGLSPNYFIKLFKKFTNVTPAEYIISIRLANAQQLLIETKLTISQIAEMCGFNDTSYFSYCFKKNTGTSPLEYRKNINNTHPKS